MQLVAKLTNTMARSDTLRAALYSLAVCFSALLFLITMLRAYWSIQI